MTCATCRHFRRAIAAGLGYCALERRREVVGGDEIRPCWQAPSAPDPQPGLFAFEEPAEAPAAAMARNAILPPSTALPIATRNSTPRRLVEVPAVHPARTDR
jgi:hypothetical protein